MFEVGYAGSVKSSVRRVEGQTCQSVRSMHDAFENMVVAHVARVVA